MEEIDDDADQKGIGFVKISDQYLAFEYGLEELPALVYYRKKIPIVYDGECHEVIHEITKIPLTDYPLSLLPHPPSS